MEISGELATVVSSLCSLVLLPRDERTQSVVLQQMGMCGHMSLAHERQQLYSLLSTVQKLRWCAGEGNQLVHDGMASTCCLAAAHAAVELLKMPSSASSGRAAVADQQCEPSAAAAGATTARHRGMDQLPSLVILGRSLLQWAGQLQQQAPELVLLGLGELQQGQHRGTLLHEHGVTRVCIPRLREGSAIKPRERLESLVGTVFEWVGGIDSPTLEQLAAAGCSPQQLQQQLDALLSAQQGTQQGLTAEIFLRIWGFRKMAIFPCA
jgi:hypothetical protein